MNHIQQINKLISLNSSAVYLWNEVEGKEFDEQTLAALLVKKYRIDEKRALEDKQKAAEQAEEPKQIEAKEAAPAVESEEKTDNNQETTKSE